MPVLPDDSEACTHVPIKTRVNWSSPAHYNVASYVWFFLIADFCFRSRVCLESVVIADRAATIFPRRSMCRNWWLYFFIQLQKLHKYFSYLISRWLLPLSLKFRLCPPCLEITLFLHATSYKDVLNPIMFLAATARQVIFIFYSFRI